MKRNENPFKMGGGGSIDSATLSSAVHVERAMPHPHQITYCHFPPERNPVNFARVWLRALIPGMIAHATLKMHLSGTSGEFD